MQKQLILLILVLLFKIKLLNKNDMKKKLLYAHLHMI